MIINRLNFLQILAKHLIRKTSAIEPSFLEINLTATAIAPLFTSIEDSLKKKGIMNDDYEIKVELLDSTLTSIFKVMPIFNIPIGDSFIKIDQKDAIAFMKEVYSFSKKEEVICLPCQS